MSITGVFGNLSVCCVILRIPAMRSATNYYLFSLAVADLLILLLGKKKRNQPNFGLTGPRFRGLDHHQPRLYLRAKSCQLKNHTALSAFYIDWFFR